MEGMLRNYQVEERYMEGMLRDYQVGEPKLKCFGDY